MTYDEDLESREDENGGVTPSDQLEAAVNELRRILETPGLAPDIVGSLSQIAHDLSLLAECVP